MLRNGIGNITTARITVVRTVTIPVITNIKPIRLRRTNLRIIIRCIIIKANKRIRVSYAVI